MPLFKQEPAENPNLFQSFYSQSEPSQEYSGQGSIDVPTKAVLPAAAAPTDVYNVPLKVEETASPNNAAGDGGEVFYIFYESDDKKPKAPSQVSSS